MKRTIFMATMIVISGCSITPMQAKYGDNLSICKWAHKWYMTTESQIMALQEVASRKVECSTYLAVDQANNLNQSAVLLDYGQKMMQQSNPQPAQFITPPAPLTQCYSYYNSVMKSYSTTCR